MREIVLKPERAHSLWEWMFVRVAGLDHPPRKGQRCEGTCYVGVRPGALEAWKAVVKARAGQVPCDKEFEECAHCPTLQRP